MKQSTIGIFFAIVIFVACTSMVIDARSCWGAGYAGCNDGGCNRAGGYCQNFGRPPNNDCRCIGANRPTPGRPPRRPG